MAASRFDSWTTTATFRTPSRLAPSLARSLVRSRRGPRCQMATTKAGAATGLLWELSDAQLVGILDSEHAAAATR